MRPLNLTMKAFGPYKSHEHIDFTSLGERNLFLITGTTGAGKTSIFDAIAYALYGEASGSDRDYKSLISDFAADEAITQVIFEFSLKGNIYRVERTPAQERKKLTGEGMTAQAASAKLFQIGQEGQETALASRRVKDVDERLMELIGLDANQFKQIIMLPQNAFRELLTSKSDERQMILQRLFMTQKYQRFETLIKEKTKEIKAQLESIEIDISHELSEVLIDQEQAQIDPITPEIAYINLSIDNLRKLIQENTSRRESLERQIYELEKKATELGAFISEKAIEHDAFERRERLTAELEALKEKKSEMDSLEQRLKRAAKALFVSKEAEILEGVKTERTQAGKELVALEKNKDISTQEHENASQELEKSDTQLKAQLDELKLKRQSLTSYVADIKRFRTCESARCESKSLLAKLEAELNAYRQSGDALKVDIEKKKGQIKALDHVYVDKDALNGQYRDIKQKLNNYEKLYEILQRYEKEAKRHEKLTSQYRQKRAEIKSKESENEKIKDSLEALKRLYDKNIAYKLAVGLKEGQPCPVCGSQHHPSPSQMSHEVDEVELESLEKDNKALETTINTLKGQLVEIEKNGLASNSELEALWAQIVAHPANDYAQASEQAQFKALSKHLNSGLKSFVAKEKQIEKEIMVLSKAEINLNKLKKDLEKSEGLLKSTTGKCEELEKRYNEKKIEYTKLESKASSLKESVPEQYLEDKALEREQARIKDAIEKLEERIEKIKKLYEKTKLRLNTLNTQIEVKEKACLSLDEKLKVQTQKLENSLEENGFSSFEEYKRSVMAQDAIRAKQKELDEFTDVYREKSSLLSSLNFQLKGKTKPDIQGLQKEQQSLNKTIDELKVQKTRMTDKIVKNERRLRKIIAFNEKRVELDEKYGTYGFLKGLTSGSNNYRINFERFVQTSFLDDILFAANQKLDRMTDGRYLLSRMSKIENLRSTQGLDIEVFDQYTGEARHVKTLSGGEGFKASLAMALGLCEVVQSNSGGVSLDTLFIDEGFGSLDSESLDNAIKTLMELQSGGRLVGIISHVEELKERIDTYLEVTSTKNGSYTKFFIP